MKNNRVEIKIREISSDLYLVIEISENNLRTKIYNISEETQGKQLNEYINELENNMLEKGVATYSEVELPNNSTVIIATKDGSTYEICQKFWKGQFKNSIINSDVEYKNKEQVKSIKNLTINRKLAAVILIGALIVGGKFNSMIRKTSDKDVTPPPALQTEIPKEPKGNITPPPAPKTNIPEKTINNNISILDQRAKKIALQFSTNPTEQEITIQRNIILFISKLPVPNTFDVNKDFIQPIINISRTNFIATRAKYINDNEISEKRIPIKMELYFSEKNDIEAVKHFNGKIQSIFDAIYTNQPKEEIRKLVYTSIEDVIKLMNGNVVGNGITYNEISNEARAVILNIGGMSVAYAPEYKDINLLSKNVNAELNGALNIIFRSIVPKQSNLLPNDVKEETIEFAKNNATEQRKVYIKVMHKV